MAIGCDVPSSWSCDACVYLGPWESRVQLFGKLSRRTRLPLSPSLALPCRAQSFYSYTFQQLHSLFLCTPGTATIHPSAAIIGGDLGAHGGRRTERGRKGPHRRLVMGPLHRRCTGIAHALVLWWRLTGGKTLPRWHQGIREAKPRDRRKHHEQVGYRRRGPRRQPWRYHR